VRHRRELAADRLLSESEPAIAIGGHFFFRRAAASSSLSRTR
jgi:hypothetical protein